MKWLSRIVVLIILIVAGWWLMSRLKMFPSFGNLFKPQKVAIDQTPVLLQQIKPLAQLVTLSAYDEIVADSTMPTTIGERLTSILNPFKFNNVYTEKKLIIIGKAMTHVGIDLQKMKTKNLQVENDSIHIILPPAEILDVIINPSGTEVFLEQGNWDPTAIEALKSHVQSIAVQHVKDNGLLQQSEAKARQVFTNFFLAAGFKKVSIEFKDTRLM